MSKYHLFLDDERNPEDCCGYMPNKRYYWDTEFIVVRNYVDFVSVIKEQFKNGNLPECVSFDHDLADTHYSLGVHNKELWEKYHDEPNHEKTGYDCAKFLTEFCAENNLPLPEYFVHSMNTIGRKNIVSWLENFKKHHVIH
jgi:hypothetical protein